LYLAWSQVYSNPEITRYLLIVGCFVEESDSSRLGLVAHQNTSSGPTSFNPASSYGVLFYAPHENIFESILMVSEKLADGQQVRVVSFVCANWKDRTKLRKDVPQIEERRNVSRVPVFVFFDLRNTGLLLQGLTAAHEPSICAKNNFVKLAYSKETSNYIKKFSETVYPRAGENCFW